MRLKQLIRVTKWSGLKKKKHTQMFSLKVPIFLSVFRLLLFLSWLFQKLRSEALLVGLSTVLNNYPSGQTQRRPLNTKKNWTTFPHSKKSGERALRFSSTPAWLWKPFTLQQHWLFTRQWLMSCVAPPTNRKAFADTRNLTGPPPFQTFSMGSLPAEHVK